VAAAPRACADALLLLLKNYLISPDLIRPHLPADLLAIHSVCVDAARRRRGVATRLLRAYQAYVRATTPQLRECRLICKHCLVPLYAGAGFVMVGPSEVVHGQDPWFEMRWAPDGVDSGSDSGGGAS
jgi:GNAT superfamily N-acetyltransferase